MDIDFTRISARHLKALLHGTAEIALFDVREHGEYGEGHPFLACSLPYSRLELELPRLAPRHGVPIVFLDDDERIAKLAVKRAAALGYTNLAILEGGLPAWRDEGYGVFAGVNLPSKTFAEMVEHHYGTPSLPAKELAKKMKAGNEIAILDGRTLAEFEKMSIPGAISCPNGELPYRLRDVVPSDSTPIVINCAGRTRSIIGAQTLIQLGVSNPVMALRNGTQGWYLADLPLDHGSTLSYPDVVTPSGANELRQAAQALLSRYPVSVIDASTLEHWLLDDTRSLFCFDIRGEAEYRRQPVNGVRNVPGGQLLQTLDQHVGVRNARIVLVDTDGVRAPVVGHWLVQMGHAVALINADALAGIRLPDIPAWRPPHLPTYPLNRLLAEVAAGNVQLIDVRSSTDFRQAHIPGARWSIRPRVVDDVAALPTMVVIAADDPAIAALAALELPPGLRPHSLEGGFTAWQRQGLPVTASPYHPPDADCIDFLFFVHDRHAGNKESAQRYLAWEMGLIAQLDEQERRLFTFANGGKVEHDE